MPQARRLRRDGDSDGVRHAGGTVLRGDLVADRVRKILRPRLIQLGALAGFDLRCQGRNSRPIG